MAFFTIRGARVCASVVACLALASGCDGGGTADGGEAGLDGGDGSEGGLDGGHCPLQGADSETAGVALVVGTGRDGSLEGFQALSPGDTLWLEPGEQGLQHLLVALRGREFEPRLPLVSVQAFRASDCEPVGGVRFRLPFQADAVDPTLLDLPTFRVLILDDADRFEYCTVLDRDVDLMIDLDDGMGERAHREIRVHVGGIDPNARPDLRDAWLSACAPRDGGVGDAQ